MYEKDRHHLLNEYARGYQKLKDAVEKYPEEMWRYKPDEHSWSIQEIIIHMADSEVNAFVRCRKLIAENGASIYAYNQDMWASELRYQEQNAGDALELFKWLRTTTYKLLKDTPDLTWATHAVNHPERGNITLDDWLEIYTDHVEGHIRQMQRVFDSWKKSEARV